MNKLIQEMNGEEARQALIMVTDSFKIGENSRTLSVLLANIENTIANGSWLLGEVKRERERQDRKWGGAEHDDHHNITDFCVFIRNYACWAGQMDIMGSQDKARRRLIQVAALAVAAVESIDRKDDSNEVFLDIPKFLRTNSTEISE